MVPVRTGAGAAAPVENRGLMDIEVARRRSHETTAVRAGARTRMTRFYSTLDQYNMLGRITRLPRWSRRDVLAEDHGGPGRLGAGAKMVPLEVGSRYGADRQR